MSVKKTTLIRIGLMILLFAIVEPTGFIGTWVHTLCGGLRMLAVVISVLIYIIDRQYKNSVENILLAFIFLIGLSTLVFSGAVTDDCSYFIRIGFSAVIILQYLFTRDAKKTCRDIGFMLSIFLVMDAMTWVLPGLGMQVGYSIKCFLGTKTTITYYMVPAFAFDYAYYSLCSVNEKRIARASFIMAIGGTIAYLIQMPISTTIVCLFLIVLLLLTIQNNYIYKFFSKSGLAIVIALDLLYLLGGSIGLFNSIFNSVLHETTDMTGRLQLWQLAFLYISKRPLLGYGIGTGIYLSTWSKTNISAHNLFLGITMKAGLIGLILFISILFYFQNRNNEEAAKGSRLCLFMTMIVIILNIEGITEDFINYSVTFFLLSLVGNAPQISLREVPFKTKELRIRKRHG